MGITLDADTLIYPGNFFCSDASTELNWPIDGDIFCSVTKYTNEDNIIVQTALSNDTSVKYYRKGTIDLDGSIDFTEWEILGGIKNGASNSLSMYTIPVGAIVHFAIEDVPDGYLLCDGRAVGRVAYHELFDVVGTKYGEGDGMTTFNLPNLIDKFVEGTNSASVGTEVSAGLPNITGNFNPYAENGSLNTVNGAFYYITSTQKGWGTSTGLDSDNSLFGFDASRSSPIYGNSTTVQPPALKLLPCIKAYTPITVKPSKKDTIQSEIDRFRLQMISDFENLVPKDGTPVGMVVYLAVAQAPPGYLVCDGSEVSREAYPRLFGAIGTTYGSGDGVTTFNLPNLLDKFIEGTNNSVGTSVAAGLPNITGSFHTPRQTSANSVSTTGSIRTGSASGQANAIYGTTASTTMQLTVDIDASRSSSIYGNSNTVQPPALKLLPCIKAFSPIMISEEEHENMQETINILRTEFNALRDSLRDDFAALNDVVNSIGTITFYSGTSIPNKHLLCNGQAVSRTTYSALFNIIGTRYGTGDGSTTFNIPNLIDRFPQGNATPGTVKNAGLPNITGVVGRVCTNGAANAHVNVDSTSGAFYTVNVSGGRDGYTEKYNANGYGYPAFNASRSSSIYGNSTTVQPPALTLVPIIRALL